MQRIVSKLAMVFTVLLLALAAAAGVAWLRQAIPVGDLPDQPIPKPGKTAPIEQAAIPWKHNAAHPLRVPQPMAFGGLAWPASAAEPAPVNLSAIAVPWSADGVAPANVVAAAVPWIVSPPSAENVPAPVAILPAVLPWPIDKK